MSSLSQPSRKRAFGKEGARALLIEALRNSKPPVEDIPAFLPPANEPPVSQSGLGGTQIAPEPENAPAASAGACETPKGVYPPDARYSARNCTRAPEIIMPTADEVARAIVAAARETEELEHVLVDLDSPNMLRCRHYAMHAISHVFQGLPIQVLGRLVGARKPGSFWKNSMILIAPKSGTSRRRCLWWSDEAYDRVIRAIRP